MLDNINKFIFSNIFLRLYIMRQKKSKAIYYIAGFIILAAILFIASREVPVKVEHVEQPLENSFLNK